MTNHIRNVRRLEHGLHVNRSELFRLGPAVLFLVLFTCPRGPEGPTGTLLVMAAKIFSMIPARGG